MFNILNKFQSVVESLIALLYIYGGISLIGMPPLQGEGLLVLVFGGQVALYFYMVWFTLLGVGLIYSKVRRKKKLHKHVLMAMYLTTIYTASLTIALFGFHLVGIIDDIVIGTLTAWFWLRWKLLTEYINPKDFDRIRHELLDDDQHI